jgi:hypothetical protein
MQYIVFVIIDDAIITKLFFNKSKSDLRLFNWELIIPSIFSHWNDYLITADADTHN